MFLSACVLMLISFWPTWRLAVMSHTCQLITQLQLFTRKDTVTKENVETKEPANVVVGLQLLELSSITTLNQTILNVRTRYTFKEFLFSKNIGNLTDLR